MSHCVYVLTAADGEVLYVGETSNLDRRLVQHQQTKPWWTDVEHVAWLPCDRADATQTEDELTRRLTPAHVARGYRHDAYKGPNPCRYHKHCGAEATRRSGAPAWGARRGFRIDHLCESHADIRLRTERHVSEVYLPTTRAPEDVARDLRRRRWLGATYGGASSWARIHTRRLKSLAVLASEIAA